MTSDQLSALLSALHTLPPYPGPSCRGYTGRQGQAFQRAIPSGVLVSTSRDPRVATDNFSSDRGYAVIGRRGRDLTSVSEHPEQQEVVFLPGSVHLPIERFDVNELEAQLTKAIRNARGRPPVEPVTSGKFTGPLT